MVSRHMVYTTGFGRITSLLFRHVVATPSKITQCEAIYRPPDIDYLREDRPFSTVTHTSPWSFSVQEANSRRSDETTVVHYTTNRRPHTPSSMLEADKTGRDQRCHEDHQATGDDNQSPKLSQIYESSIDVTDTSPPENNRWPTPPDS